MTNKPHYLGKAGQAKPVPRFAILAAHNRKTYCKETKAIVLKCTAWSVRVICHDGTDYYEECVRSGDTVDGKCPWQSIMSLLQNRRMLDVWCIGCLDTMASTGFFQLIDNGRISMFNDKWQGLAIISNPPVMVKCKPAKGSGIMRIMCLGNIGIHSMDDLSMMYKAESWEDYVQTGEVWSDSQVACSMSSWCSHYLQTWFTTIELEKLGAIKTTLAGQSWSAFRHRFLRHPLLAHNDNIAHNLEYNGTYSGRAECFRIGHVDGPLYHYDVKSCYPSLLKGERVPCRLKYVCEGNASTLRAAMESGYVCIADITLSTRCPRFPLKRECITLWPTGTFRTVLCGKELSAAMSLTPEPLVHVFATYESDFIFDDWIDWAMEYRRQCSVAGSRIGENVAKLLANSLWGRFAKRDKHWSNVDDDSSVVDWADWWEREPGSTTHNHYRSFGGLCQCMEDNGFNREAIPIVTAFINSLGRDYLWRLMSFVGLDSVAYCATDSLMVNGKAHAMIASAINQESLRKCAMKLTNVYDCLLIRGIHHYGVPDAFVDAGVPLGSLRNEYGKATWTSIEPLVGPMSRNECPSNRIVQRSVDTQMKYQHGVVMPDGRVRPHHIIMET